jgi:predicted dehydrogenase
MSGVRWGLIGTGRIASRFVADLALLPDSVPTAVGSRTMASASGFAEQFGIPNRHGSYEDLVHDPAVDAVYVATPHPGHHDAALAALRAGKHVLVEKPFTMDAVQAAGLVGEARTRGLFLMEAMWTRFLPHMVRVRDLLAAGALGEVLTVVADHAQWFAADEANRLYAPALGGGALLDLGIYPVSLSSMVLGPPSRVTAVSHRAFTGVDAQTSILLDHEGGAHAVLTTTLAASGSNRAAIVGTDALIEIDPYWLGPSSFTLHRRDGRSERFDRPHEGNGLRHQAAEVARCLRSGLLESPVMPLDETVAVMRTLDEVRQQIGLAYPP